MELGPWFLCSERPGRDLQPCAAQVWRVSGSPWQWGTERESLRLGKAWQHWQGRLCGGERKGRDTERTRRRANGMSCLEDPSTTSGTEPSKLHHRQILWAKTLLLYRCSSVPHEIQLSTSRVSEQARIGSQRRLVIGRAAHMAARSTSCRVSSRRILPPTIVTPADIGSRDSELKRILKARSALRPLPAAASQGADDTDETGIRVAEWLDLHLTTMPWLSVSSSSNAVHWSESGSAFLLTPPQRPPRSDATASLDEEMSTASPLDGLSPRKLEQADHNRHVSILFESLEPS